MDETLNYYNENAESFINGTVAVDFEKTQKKFLEKLPSGAYILDFGCGSGRDTKYFLEHGYKVDAIDGSDELVRYASEYTGIKVRKMLFQELDVNGLYDGIWACSSILHFKDFIKDISSIDISEYWISSDVGQGREDEKWLNLMLV
jgi:2-polyprenyl-3-methyl-5-hydroxy-6-metoxy-1,4-benzoquinol methylase